MHLSSPYCLVCGDEIETVLHVLGDCSKWMNLWLNIVDVSSRELFFNSTLQHWIQVNLNGHIKGIGVKDWPSYWATAIHSLWFWKNKEEHDDGFIRPANLNMYVARTVREYEAANRVNDVALISNRVIRHVGWKPPMDDWVVVNTDGAKKNNSLCGCGGLVHGKDCVWRGGFARGLGDCDVIMVELWGVLEGLNYARRLGFRRIELHSDSQVVVHMLNNAGGNYSIC
jgi:hypothetical protein